MSFRTFLAAPLALAISLPAQIDAKPAPAATPTPTPNGQEPKPATTQEPTPAQVLEQLQAEKQRLENEIRYAKERAQNAKSLLARKLAGNDQQFRAIDAGKKPGTNPVASQPVQRRYARLAAEGEWESKPEGTILVVEGRGISQAWLDKVVDYLRASEAPGDENMLTQRALFDLIRIEAIAGQFEENEGEVHMAESTTALDNGTTLAEIARKSGSVLGADENGRLELTRNSVQGPLFEAIAFDTPAGERTRPFRNTNGYVILQVDEVVPGETRQLDKVVCHVAQFAYTDDAERLKQAQFRVNSGQCDIVARDQAVLEMLPALFRPQTARVLTPQQIEAQISGIDALLQKLESAGEGDSDRAKSVREQRAALQKQLEQMQKSSDETDADKAAGDADAKPDAPQKPKKDGR